jgi:asparagine synthase (glutamine-hydrolysing)
LAEWLQSDLCFLIEDFLNRKIIEKYNLVDYQKVRAIKEAFLKGNKFYYNRLWVLIVLHQFLEKNF